MQCLKIATLTALILQVQEISGFIKLNNICDSASLLSGTINLNDFPLNFEVEVPNVVVSGDIISIKIKNFDGDQLSGILIQAKNTEDASVGIFIPNQDLNSTDCNSGIVYESTASKHEIITKWQSPVIKETINFRFYVTIIESSISFGPLYATDLIAITKDNNPSLGWIYDGCDDTKVCIGVPDGCVDSKNCNLFGAVIYENNNFIFELLSLPTHNYIAYGISQTPIMSNTSAIECIQEVPGVITAYTSWMLARSAFREGIDQTIISLLESRFIDGRIYCRVQRETVSIVNEQIFDLEDDFYLLIASGTALREDSVGPHGANRGATQERISLLNPTPPSTEAPPDDVYQGCGTKKLCFGFPSGCISPRNCQLLTTIMRVNSEFYEFEMLSLPMHYIAFGITQTSDMGDASVIECIQTSPGIVSAFASWNYLRDVSRQDINQSIIRLSESRIINGRVYCKVERSIATVVRGQLFHLDDQKHYLLMAGGLFFSDNGVGAHGPLRDYSDNKHWLNNPGEVYGAPISPLLLTHGSLMIVAWIGLTSIGIVFAGYYKPLWSGRQVLGKDLWFFWHACCMSLTALLTLIGFIVIFVNVGGWHTTVHSILGCVVFSLAMLQAIGGMMRPDPKAEKRPVFNFMHKSLGNITHFLAVLTIFYAIPLPSARLPTLTSYVLAGFLSFYICIHLVLSTIDINGQIKRQQREEKVEIQATKKPPYGLLKTSLLLVHIVVIVIFVIALILIFMLDF